GAGGWKQRLLASDDDAEVAGRGRPARLIAELHHLEIIRGQRAKGGVQHTVVPARVVGAAHIQVRPVVCDYQAVSLHRAEDPLHLRGKSRDVTASLEAETCTHG